MIQQQRDTGYKRFVPILIHCFDKCFSRWKLVHIYLNFPTDSIQHLEKCILQLRTVWIHQIDIFIRSICKLKVVSEILYPPHPSYPNFQIHFISNYKYSWTIVKIILFFLVILCIDLACLFVIVYVWIKYTYFQVLSSLQHRFEVLKLWDMKDSMYNVLFILNITVALSIAYLWECRHH